MKLYIISGILLLLSLNGFAQFDQVSIGEGYVNQTFYSLSDEGTISSIEHESWDIAFSTQGVQDAGIFINEGASLTALEQVELYDPVVADFEVVIDLDFENWERLYNPDLDWQNGAFNSVKDEDDVFDYGWGQYNPSIFTVEGKRVYVIKLRNGEWKKIFIESLLFEWIFKYANLDGTDLVEKTIPKADHQEAILAYYSFESEDVVDLEPSSWDLLFTRYNTYTDDGLGNFRNYVVSGVLSGLDVQVAQFDDIDPDDIDDEDVFDEDYAGDIDAIGFDWKTVDINTAQYTVKNDQVFFVRKPDSTVCKVEFIDFEGSTTGVTTIKKDCGLTAQTTNLAIDGLSLVSLFPNPTTDYINLVTEFEEKTTAIISIIDMNGRLIKNFEHNFYAGFQHGSISINQPAGRYQLIIKAKEEIQIIPFIVN